jgi:hypothetical protein
MKAIHRKLLIYIGIPIADVLFFGLTNPGSLNPALLLMSFVLLTFSFYVIASSIIWLLKKAGLGVVNRRRLAIYIAIFGMIIVALQSIGQFSWRDVVVLVPFALISYFYIGYLRTSRK